MACKTLGLPSSGAMLLSADDVDPGSADFVADAFGCRGNETSLLDCSYGNNTEDCYSDDVVGLLCMEYTPRVGASHWGRLSSTACMPAVSSSSCLLLLCRSGPQRGVGEI